MAASDKLLFTDVLECLTGVHQYLLQDLANERLSQQNQIKKKQHVSSVNTLMQRIQSSHPSVRPRMNPPGSMPPPPQRMVPPPPPIPTEDEEEEPQDTYEVPEIKDSPEHYLSFEPAQSQPEEPQEEYLTMEGDEDRIPEETYEDPSQTIMDDENQDLYEEAVPLSLEPPTATPSINVSSPPPSSSFEPAGYMDPTQLKPDQSGVNNNNRASLVPEELIEDWEYAYEQSGFGGKKKEKVKVSNLKNIVTKGWLEKLGGRNQTSWQKRYCVLADVFLYFYEKESASTYNNRIPIPGFVPSPAPDLTRPKRNHYAFKLSCMSMKGVRKDYYLRVKTEGECKTWIEALKICGDMGRGVLENKRKSMTLPNTSRTAPSNYTPQGGTLLNIEERRGRSSSDTCIEEEEEDFEQDNYEELQPAQISVDDDQEEYVDVTPGQDNIEPQEDYVDLQPTHTPFIEEEPQEDYVEAADVQPLRLPPPPKPISATPQLPLPPPPPSSSSNSPPPPKPLPRSLPPRPDPVVDTNKVYVQQNKNSIQYKNVFVILWDFVTGESDEISLQRGDLVHVADPIENSEWWYGDLLDQNATRKLGKSGLFPSSYSSSAFEVIS